MDASSELENEAITALTNTRGGDVIWEQKRVEKKVASASGVLIRGHIDGLWQQDDTIIEVKSLGRHNFDAYNSGDLEGLGSLGLKYRWQGAFYGHATSRKVRFVIYNKQATDGERERGDDLLVSQAYDPEELVAWQEIVDRVGEVERYAAVDELPECDRGCTRSDAYGHTHIFASSVMLGDDELEGMLARHHKLSVQMDELKIEKDELSDAIKNQYGPGLHVVGRYKAQIVQTKGTVRLDSKKLKLERPDVYEEFTVMGMPQVRLTVTMTGGDDDNDR